MSSLSSDLRDVLETLATGVAGISGDRSVGPQMSPCTWFGGLCRDSEFDGAYGRPHGRTRCGNRLYVIQKKKTRGA